jgi:hypothetical protein
MSSEKTGLKKGGHRMSDDLELLRVILEEHPKIKMKVLDLIKETLGSRLPKLDKTDRAE